jgi:hypothetical protein
MARASSIINKFGKMAGWNSVTVNLLGRDVEGISEVTYDDNVEIEGARGAGMFFCGYGEGNYEAKCSLTLFLEEWNAIQKSLPKGKLVSDIAPFNVIIEYEYNNFKVRDVITYCKFKGRGVAVKQGDKTIAYKSDLFVGGKIDWNS